MNNCNEQIITAGDDFTLSVELAADSNDVCFEDYTAEMIIHYGEEKEIFLPTEYEKNTVKFHLSGRDTEKLIDDNPSGEFYFCVKLRFSDGSRYTPVYRHLLLIERC